MTGRRHSRPPFGDGAQIGVAFAKRRDAFWSLLKAADASLACWPEFAYLFGGDETAKWRGVDFTRMEVLGELAEEPSLLQMPTAHVSDAQMLKVIRRVLVHLRVRMKSCAIEHSTVVKLWPLPAAIVRAMDTAAVERHSVLIAEVNRVKSLPTRTKREAKHRKQQKKALRRSIVEFAHVTFEGESLDQIAATLLTHLKAQDTNTEQLRRAA